MKVALKIEDYELENYTWHEIQVGSLFIDPELHCVVGQVDVLNVESQKCCVAF